MAGITHREGMSSEEVSSRYGLGELNIGLRVRRMRWFGHMERRDGGGSCCDGTGRLPSTGQAKKDKEAVC